MDKPSRSASARETLTYLYRDQVGSVVLTSQDGQIVDNRQYYAYGTKRGGDELPFEPNYTGQRQDDTGLLYYGARYYDPALGMFISPDSMIPDPSDFFSYNRYLYARGNPLSNHDPTGHGTIPCCVTGPTLAKSTIEYVAEVFGVTPENVSALLRAGASLGCWMTKCDLTIQDIEAGLENARENYVDPHLPDQVVNAIEVTDEILEMPVVAESMMLAAGVPPGPRSTTVLYRAVSEAEFAQLSQTGKFQIIGTSVEGKYFAESAEHAVQWGDQLLGKGNYRVIAVELPSTVADDFYRWERLDQIGPARYASIEQLEEVFPIIREVKP